MCGRFPINAKEPEKGFWSVVKRHWGDAWVKRGKHGGNNRIANEELRKFEQRKTRRQQRSYYLVQWLSVLFPMVACHSWDRAIQAKTIWKRFGALMETHRNIDVAQSLINNVCENSSLLRHYLLVRKIAGHYSFLFNWWEGEWALIDMERRNKKSTKLWRSEAR